VGREQIASADHADNARLPFTRDYRQPAHPFSHHVVGRIPQGVIFEDHYR
jgi:hypothetical protein